MAQTIVKLVIMIFISLFFQMLAMYSTVFKARARRTFVVYEVVAVCLITSDNNLVLGIIEFILFQIIAIFSTIGCLYAYAEIEISEKKSASKNKKDCTALVKIPSKRYDIEVNQETIDSIQELTLCVFIACVAAILIIRPVLLFPFYGKNAVLFMFSIAIVVATFYISIAGGDSRRVINTNDTGWGESFFYMLLFVFIAYGIIQLIGLFAYWSADEEARENNIVQEYETNYNEMLPINSIYDYRTQIPSTTEDFTDNTYLLIINDHRLGKSYYYCLQSFDEVQRTANNYSNHIEVYVHLIEKDIEPHLDIRSVFYINPKGEKKIEKYTYHFYLSEEQIITH